MPWRLYPGVKKARLRVFRSLGAAARSFWVARREPRGDRAGHLDGFDLHANVWVPPNDRARLDQLCRYLLRPPLAQDRLRLRPDGRVLVELPDGVARRHLPLPLRAHRIPREAGGPHPPSRGELASLPRRPRLARALALPGRPLRPPRPRRCRPHARGPPRRPHPRLDLGGVDAPYARSRCPRLAPLWRPAAHRRHHPGSGTSCAPSSPTSTWRRAPTSPRSEEHTSEL